LKASVLPADEPARPALGVDGADAGGRHDGGAALRSLIEGYERSMILAALAAVGDRQRSAAALLRILASRLHLRLQATDPARSRGDSTGSSELELFSVDFRPPPTRSDFMPRWTVSSSSAWAMSWGGVTSLAVTLDCNEAPNARAYCDRLVLGRAWRIRTIWSGASTGHFASRSARRASEDQ